MTDAALAAQPEFFEEILMDDDISAALRLLRARKPSTGATQARYEVEEEKDLTLGEAWKSDRRGGFYHLLGIDPHGHYVRAYVHFDLVPVLHYRYGEALATVRPVGPVGGEIFFPNDQKLIDLSPAEPGEYYLDQDGIHPVGWWPSRGGPIRRLFCKLRLHRRPRLEGYERKVRQCPHCLQVKISGTIWGSKDQDAWAAIEAYEQSARGYDGKLPLPRGPVYFLPIEV